MPNVAKVIIKAEWPLASVELKAMTEVAAKVEEAKKAIAAAGGKIVEVKTAVGNKRSEKEDD